jgi:tetratricopeptide (TPR) repeat protein
LADLDAIARRFDDPGAGCMLAITGMGGIGKTVFACMVADRLAARYPDGRIFFAARNATRGDLLAHVIRSFRFTDKLDPDETGLVSTYHTTLAGKRVLLVLDDVSPEQVQDLTCPTGCAMVLTSRQQLTLPGLYTYDLAPLPRAEAEKLLRGLVPRLSDVEVGMIAEFCGGLPLALRLAGAFLASRADLDASRYLERLRESRLGERAGLSEIAAMLRRSEEALAEPLRTQWHDLAVFVAGFETGWAATVWDCPLDSAEERLTALRASSVLTWDTDERLFCLYDLVRDFAWGQLDAATREVVLSRHGLFCLAELKCADTLYARGGEGILEALRRFDRVWPEIKAAFARSRGSEDPEALRFCVELADRSAFLRSLRQHPHEGIDWGTAALDAARALNDRRAEGIALSNLGKVCADRGQPRRAIELHEQALAIARESGDRRGECVALDSLGKAHADMGDSRRAVEVHEQLLAIAREIGDRRAEGTALDKLGAAFFNLGQTQRAIELHQQALAIAREIGDRRAESSAAGNLGKAYFALGQMQRAIEHYEQRFSIAREIGDRLGMGKALSKLGRAMADSGQPQKAIELHGQRLKLARELGDRRGEAGALGNLGKAYAALGEMQRAIELYQQDLAITREIGDRRGESTGLGNLGSAHRRIGQPQRAVEFLEQALEVARTIGDRRAEGQHLENLGLACNDLGRFGRALECFQRQRGCAREIGDREGEATACRRMGEALQALDRLEEALPLLDVWVAYQREIQHPDAEETAARVAKLHQSLRRPGTDSVAEILTAIAAPRAPLAPLLLRYRTAEYLPLWRQDVELYRRFGKGLLHQGYPVEAYELIAEGLSRDHPEDEELLYLEGLALANGGNFARAQEKIDSLLRRDDLLPRLEVQALALLGWAFKYAYLRERDPTRQTRLAIESAEHYEQAFDLDQDVFPGIAAATMSLLGGDDQRSRFLAGRALTRALEQAMMPDAAGDYWLQAILGQAHLLLGETEEAAACFREFMSLVGNEYDDVGSVKQVLKLLQRKLPGEVAAVQELLRVGPIVVFAGQRIDSPREQEAGLVRFPSTPELEAAVRQAIADELDRLNPIVGFCVPSCGADLLFAELMLQRGRELHVVLPFQRDDFFRTRVDYGHDSLRIWRDRCLRVLEPAEVHHATGEEFVDEVTPFEFADRVMQGGGRVLGGGLDGLMLFRFADRLMQGLALTQARALDVEARALIVFDSLGGHDSGDAPFVRDWESTARTPPVVIDLADLRQKTGVQAAPGSNPLPSRPRRIGVREVRAMLFADIKSFARPPERKVAEFFLAFLRQAQRFIEGTASQRRRPERGKTVLCSNTWGDGLSLVMQDARSAADLAMQMLEDTAYLNWEQLGLPADTQVRIALHAGPVFKGPDPVLGRDNYFGRNATRAADIVSATMPGCAFATEQFAACLYVEGHEEFVCEYVGTHSTARELDRCMLYRVERR